MISEYVKTDNGNCRAYYRHDKKVFCLQLNNGQYEYLQCTKDGEPSHPVTMPVNIELPHGHTSTDKEIKLYLRKLIALRAGRYSFPVPPSCTAAWSDSDWFNYIDNSGAWSL